MGGLAPGAARDGRRRASWRSSSARAPAPGRCDAARTRRCHAQRDVRCAGGSRARDAYRQLVRTDRASVWRSTALRRGIYVLALLPGVVAAAVGLDWASLVLLPGLVAAGAGLLFGVNAFCLDGSGALWLSSLPHPPALAFWAKTRVLLEVCAIAVVVALARRRPARRRAPRRRPSWRPPFARPPPAACR